MEALRPGLLGGSREAFAARYCARRLVPVSGGEPGRLRWFNGGLAHAAELHALLKQARPYPNPMRTLTYPCDGPRRRAGPAARELRDVPQVVLSCWRLAVSFAVRINLVREVRIVSAACDAIPGALRACCTLASIDGRRSTL